jgi:hypothetical protein
MATFQIDIEKNWTTEYWTNVYHVAATDLDDAKDQAELIIAVEQDIHNTAFTITKYRVSPYPGPSEGSIVAVNAPGEGPSGDMLPLFNVIRVDFPAPVGRPSRKYYRNGLTEAEQANGELSDTARDGYQAVVDGLTTNPDIHLVDVDGQVLGVGNVFKAVGMRQLRRGSRRRTEPII